MGSGQAASPWDQPQNVQAIQLVGLIHGVSIDHVVGNMRSYEEHFDKTAYAYHASVANSNSYAVGQLEAFGFDSPEPILPTPGWDKKS